MAKVELPDEIHKEERRNKGFKKGIFTPKHEKYGITDFNFWKADSFSSKFLLFTSLNKHQMMTVCFFLLTLGFKSCVSSAVQSNQSFPSGSHIYTNNSDNVQADDPQSLPLCGKCEIC